MSKKVIQVPFDEELLKDLNYCSKKKGMPRAALIREACTGYLKKLDTTELEQRYRKGYEVYPETPETGEAQTTLLKEFLTEEHW